ncbi:MAG: AAA family ATPase [Methylotetracoccus sp.]|jgi:hypothetical protein|nr:AAA family ATPase [Methylotetracoccus sp.]
MGNERGNRLVSSLLRPAAYPHATAQLRLLETHISWIVLTGPYAYKLKKPVNFGFVDFSTLDRRRFFCDEEVRLNRRFASDLYLGVVPVVGPDDEARIDGLGAPIEYAVKMRQFRQEQLFESLLANGDLQVTHVERIADQVAAFHNATRRSDPTTARGTPTTIRAFAEENFNHLLSAATDQQERFQLQRLREWSEQQWNVLRDLLEERRRTGFVRECHGDLHLGNLVVIDDVPTAFDCIEFNEDLRWIDMVSEIAFLGMDLEVKSARSLAYRFLNRYEAICGDYAGLQLWNFYRLYRAMVRAKVTRLTLQHSPNPDRATELTRSYQRYLDFGTDLIQTRRARLIVTRGLSGAGKSHIAAALSASLPAIWLRSDIERKRIMATDAAEYRYSAEATRKTYGHLRDLASLLIKAGLSVIVDATFLFRWQRQQQRALAAENDADFFIVDIHAPLHVLEERIQHRRLLDTDPSEATRAVLNEQRSCLEPLSDQERRHTLHVDGQRPDLPKLVADIESRKSLV